MRLKTFIDRPILSAVISIVIVFAGIIGIYNLPVERFPDIATPTISVSANYTGANAETVQKSVVVPLEEAINGVEDMLYMTSEATNTGGATIKVYFKQGIDPDIATVNVQNRVSKATGQLPADVVKGGVSVSKQQSGMVVMFSLYCSDGKFDQEFLANYMKINIIPDVLRINGVGGVNVIGSDYSMRIWLKPDVMAQYGLIPSDISAAISAQNIESPTGILGEDSENTFQYTMKYRGRFETPEEFGQIVIRSLENGEVLYLKDVADINLGILNYSLKGEFCGYPSATCMVQQTSGSNAQEICLKMDELFTNAKKELPPGVEIKKVLDINEYLDASIDNVLTTLLEAILLVIIVVFIFLQNFRAMIIPIVGIVVSLVGTFAFLALAGFSINLLTLFALVLAIGTVVDDSIIVVEAVQTKFDAGYRSPYKATVDAMGGITTAIITSTMVFMAVFIPVTFMGGTSGVFFMQFGITMAVAVGLSAVNALTLSPALCALLIRPENESENNTKLLMQRFRSAFAVSFSRMTKKYIGGINILKSHKWITGIVLVGSVVLLGLFMNNTKTALVPQEDQGTIFVEVSTAPGNTLSQTVETIKQIENAIKDIPQIEVYSLNSGNGLISGQSASVGMLAVRLKPWSQRKGKTNSIDAVTRDIIKRTAHIKDAKIFTMASPMIVGYGNSSVVELYLQDKKGGQLSDFSTAAQNYITALNQRPEIAIAFTSFNANYPQYLVNVDAAKCERMNISPKEVLNTLSGYCGGQYISDLNRFSKVYRVMMQATPEYRLDTKSLDHIFVRTSGGIAPIGQFVTLTKTYGAEKISRFNMFNSISVSSRPADGYSTGDVIQAIREVSDTSLPTGYGYEFGGLTREESGTTNNTVIIFGICLIFIYLILCALYESFLIPLAVILSVPVGLMGSFLFTKLMGLENNIYLQTGLIMLIGLLSKTAILITEYAQTARKQGMSISEAALTASSERFRPILMTALTMIFGLLPLVFATGVGANGNISLGLGAVGGMFIGTIALLFITPILYMVLQKIQEKIAPRMYKEDNND